MRDGESASKRASVYPVVLSGVLMDRDPLAILVIDDDDGMRSLLVDIISSHGHQVVPAESAERGLELLPYWTFQVAFLDQNLPGMEGLLLGEYLRRNNPDMTIALVTGEDDPRLPRRTRDLSIAFVPKPFEVRDIVRVIDDCVERARERDARRQTREDDQFEPPLSEYLDEVAAAYDMPKVPGRVEERLVKTLKRCLNNLRSVSRYTEKDRVIALCGLITARSLGVELPRGSSGQSLYEEYDELMRQHGRRPEFHG